MRAFRLSISAVVAFVVLFAAASVIAALVAFHYIFAPSRDEVAMVCSPSGEIMASLIEINGGATTSFGYEVRVASTGLHLGSKKVAYLYGASRNSSAYGLNIRWLSDSELCIEYLDARFVELPEPKVRVAGREVAVLLTSGITDPTAPAGGMLYNMISASNSGS